MARKSRAQVNSKTSNLEQKCSSSSQAKKTRTMDAILGVQAMEFENSEKDELVTIGKHLSPRSSLRELQQQSAIRGQFLDWMTAIKEIEANQGISTPILQITPGKSNSVIRSVEHNN